MKYRYGASIEDSLEKLRYDLYYVKHLSLPFDLTILFDTVKVVLFAKGRPMIRALAAHRVAENEQARTVALNVAGRYVTLASRWCSAW